MYVCMYVYCKELYSLQYVFMYLCIYVFITIQFDDAL